MVSGELSVMAASASTTDVDVEIYEQGEELHYKQIYKILVIGDSNVGKTALLTRFVEGRFQSVFMSTVGQCMHVFCLYVHIVILRGKFCIM